MLTLMSKIESQLGWPAADAYWLRVQTEVRLGTHVFLSPAGAAMCAGVYTALYHEYSGRPRSSASGTTATPKQKNTTASQCIHHPHSTSHTTATCRAAAGGTSAEGKHT